MSVIFNGIKLEGIDKDVNLVHSVSMAAMGHDQNVNTDFLDKILDIKRADVSEKHFNDINELFSVVKMNYQICNGGIGQYFGNGYHKHYLSTDREVEIFDKETQVSTLRNLVFFAENVFPDKVDENSKLARMVNFFDSLTFEENVPQYEMIYSEEDEKIWDEEEEDWVDNPDYEEPYEDIVDYIDEVRSDSTEFYADNFDQEYYQINAYLEKVVEVYAQYLYKSIEPELEPDKISLSEQMQSAEAKKESHISEVDEKTQDLEI